MSKKRESPNENSVDKVKKSKKRMVEGGKEFGSGVGNLACGTTKSIFYTLKSATESRISKVYNNKSENIEFSDEVREEYKNKSEKYSNKSQESSYKAGESFKQAGKGARHAFRGGGKAIVNTVVTGYHEVNIADEKVGQAIQKNREKHGKNNVSKTSKFLANHAVSGSIALALLGAGGTIAVQQQNINKPGGRKSEINNNIEVAGNSNQLMLIPTQGYSTLSNKTITTHAPLTRLYLGGDLENTGDLIISDTLDVNPAESLRNLWEKKIQKYGHNQISQLDTIDVSSMSPEDIEKFRANHPIDAAYLFVVRPYTDGKENKETMSLQEFIKQINKIVENTRELTQNYDGKLTGSKKELFDVMRDNITGESIVAYAMTELCENKGNKEKDGEFNKQLFDFLLRNYGANFLAKIPALYDKKTSYGLYQFTEFALYDTPGEVRGASIVNKIVPENEKIPGSVIDLKTWQDQTKAAYMLAIQNLSRAVDKLTEPQAKQLLSYQRNNKENFTINIIELISSCHHMTSAASLLEKRCKDGCKKDLCSYPHKYKKNIEPYGMASKINYKALMKK